MLQEWPFSFLNVQISMSDRKKKRMKEKAFCMQFTVSHPYLCSSILKI